MEGEAGEDGGLLRGVVAVDVGARVRLGEAELLGRGEGVLEAVALGVHAVEDVVRGAVDDAEDALDAVAGEALAQRPDDRDRPADGGLVVELGADLLGGGEQLGAVRGEQRLVAGDDVGTGVQRLQDVGAGRLDAAHELDHDVGAEDEPLGVGREQLARQVDAALRVDVAHGDADEVEAGADAVRELLPVLEQRARDLCSDGSAAEQGDAQ